LGRSRIITITNFLDTTNRPYFNQKDVSETGVLSPTSSKTYSVGPEGQSQFVSLNDLTQQSTFCLKAETDTSLRNVVSN
jgi:hypothetical protein